MTNRTKQTFIKVSRSSTANLALKYLVGTSNLVLSQKLVAENVRVKLPQLRTQAASKHQTANFVVSPHVLGVSASSRLVGILWLCRRTQASTAEAPENGKDWPTATETDTICL
tara:strand:- start:129350 stop:129688 length:339 start_codon:yes stop_codon:yes gene_type:complete